MKKIILTSLTALSFILSFTACSSTKIALRENSPAAIVSIVGNSYLPWAADENSSTSSDDDDDDSDGIINSLINKVGGANNPEVLTAIDRIDYADDSFRNIVSELAGLEFLDKEEVLNNEIYKSTRSSFYNTLSDSLRATDYKDLTVLGAKKARYLMSALGAKSLIILDFTFKKQRINERKSDKYVGGIVIMKVKVLNERGKEVINKVYTEYTTEKIKKYGSDYDKNALVDTYYSAIDNAISKFALDYMGEGSQPISEEEVKTKLQTVKIPLPEKGKNKKSTETNETDVINAKVEAAVTLVKKYNVSPEDAAKDMDAPLDKVLEALKEN